MNFKIQILLVVALLSSAATAEPVRLTLLPPELDEPPPFTLIGHPRVVDGDSLNFGWAGHPTIHVRLWGIDAPELGQRCTTTGTPPYGGTEWPAGRIAKQTLINLIGDATVTCHQIDWDAKYQRPLSRCWARSNELNKQMVERGMAWAYGRYTTHYAQQEEEAREGKRGVHGVSCTAPWQYRRERH